MHLTRNVTNALPSSATFATTAAAAHSEVCSTSAAQAVGHTYVCPSVRGAASRRRLMLLERAAVLPGQLGWPSRKRARIMVVSFGLADRVITSYGNER